MMVRSEITQCVSVTVHVKGVPQMESRTIPAIQPPVENSTRTPAAAEEVEDYDSDDASKIRTHPTHN